MQDVVEKLSALPNEKQVEIIEKLVTLKNANEVVELIGKYDVVITAEMAEKFLEKRNESSELSRESLKAVSGGGSPIDWRVILATGVLVLPAGGTKMIR